MDLLNSAPYFLGVCGLCFAVLLLDFVILWFSVFGLGFWFLVVLELCFCACFVHEVCCVGVV